MVSEDQDEAENEFYLNVDENTVLSKVNKNEQEVEIDAATGASDQNNEPSSSSYFKWNDPDRIQEIKQAFMQAKQQQSEDSTR